MNVSIPTPAAFDTVRAPAEPHFSEPARPNDSDTKETFQEILGELLFGQLLKSMRRTIDKPAYFHGGRAEEVFTQQLDQVLAQKMSRSAGEQFFGPMYALWSTGRR